VLPLRVSRVPISPLHRQRRTYGPVDRLAIFSASTPADEGLSVGMQIVTPYLRDRESIALARHAEEVVARFEPPPI
jgi:Asp-tRNA(Asn)/Glu-tRNA(Gln) amidotransferase A subunit family amidase